VPKRDSAPVGAPIWIDLSSRDMDRSRAFYGELFGWTSEVAEEFGGYVNFATDGIPVAGGMANDGASGPDAWSIYLASEDAAATVAAAGANGGAVELPPMPVGELGTMAFVTDPGGGRIGVWQPGLHRGFGIYDEIGAPAWFELHTGAYDPTVAFYRDVFHWNPVPMSDTPEFRYTTLTVGDQPLAGVMDASEYAPEGSAAVWSVYFRVADTDAALAQVERLGGAIVTPGQDSPYGRLATVADPTGAQFKVTAG
jgi:predicted enzyme related to lactoylglutathione lyase